MGATVKRFAIAFGLCVIGLLAFALPAYAQTTAKPAQTFENIVVFVQFQDDLGNFMQDQTEVDKIVAHYDDDSTSPRSLSGYLKAQSYDQFLVNSYLPQYDTVTKTITPAVLPKTREQYLDNDNSYELISDSVAAIHLTDAQIAACDMNNDRSLDNVTFIFSGGSGESDRSSILYSHKEDYNDHAWGLFVSPINVIAHDAIFGSIENPGSLSGFGTVNHEFMHSIGYPDLYKETGGAAPVGRWDLMAGTSNFMQYSLAYLRSTEYTESPGWLTIDTVSADKQGLTLVPAGQAQGNQAYILKSPLSDTEVFVVEFRKKNPTVYDSNDPASNALDTKIPGSGMVIYRINKSVERLNNRTSTVNGVYVFREPETMETLDGLNDSFYSREAGRTQKGSIDLSVTDGALVFEDGSNSGIRISNIGSAAGYTLTFDVAFAAVEDSGLWNKVAGGDVSTKACYSADSAIDGTTVYTAFNDTTNSESPSVIVSKSDNGGAWTTIGTPIPYYGDNARIEVLNGVPYVCFIDSQNWKPVLYKWSGIAWVKVSTVNFPVTRSQQLDMAVGSDGLYIVYSDEPDGFGSNSMKMLRVNADGSSTAIDTGTATGSYQYHLCVDGTDVYVSARTLNSVAVAKRISAGVVTDLSTTGIVNSQEAVITAEDGQVYLVSNGTNGAGTCVYHLVDDAFTALGGKLSSGSATAVSIATVQGTPFVLMGRQADGETHNTVVFAYRDGAWVQEGLPVDSAQASTAVLSAAGDRLYATLASPRTSSDAAPVVKTKTVDIDAPSEPTKITPPSANVGLVYSDTAQTGVAAGTGYTVVSGGSATDAGEYRAVLSLTDSENSVWSDGTIDDKTIVWSIVPCDLSKVTIAAIPDQIQTGDPIVPVLQVSFGGKALNQGTDYDLSAWSDNVAVGKASATVTGKGNYSGTRTVDFTIVAAPEPPKDRGWKRLAGDDRYGTMSRIVETGFPGTCDRVVVATGENFPDALAASALAGAYDCPVILTPKDTLGADARRQLTRLKAKNAFILGGSASVSTATEQQIRDLGVATQRVSGSDRRETSVVVARYVDRKMGAAASDTAIIACGENFADTLSISPFAFAHRAPIFLTAAGVLSDTEVAAIKAQSGTRNIVLVGGTAAVSDRVKDQLGSAYTYTRLAGADRFATSAAIGRWELLPAQGMNAVNAAVATGRNFPDALAGAALCGTDRSILVLASDTDRAAVEDVIAPNGDDVELGYFLGGQASVSEDLAAYVRRVSTDR